MMIEIKSIADLAKLQIDKILDDNSQHTFWVRKIMEHQAGDIILVELAENKEDGWTCIGIRLGVTTKVQDTEMPYVTLNFPFTSEDFDKAVAKITE